MRWTPPSLLRHRGDTGLVLLSRLQPQHRAGRGGQAQEVTQKLFGRGRPLPGQEGSSLQAAEKYRAATGLIPLTPKADPRAPCAL